MENEKKNKNDQKKNNSWQWQCNNAIVIVYKQTHGETMTSKKNENCKTKNKQKCINEIKFWTLDVKY